MKILKKAMFPCVTFVTAKEQNLFLNDEFFSSKVNSPYLQILLSANHYIKLSFFIYF